MRLLSALLLLLLGPPSPSFAAMEEIGLTARSTGMGDALTADSEGLAGLVLNPATLGHLRRSELTFGIRRLFDIPAGKTDINGMNFGIAAPLQAYGIPGAGGLSWSHDTIRPLSLDRVLGLSYGSKSWREFGPISRASFFGVLNYESTIRLYDRFRCLLL